jgi:hypothetical protein
LGYLGSIVAFITTVKAARWRMFSIKLAVESECFSWGWAGSDDERRPLLRMLCICAIVELGFWWFPGAALFCCPLKLGLLFYS